MKDELLFCPLGGSGEIGMNMNLFAYGKPGEHKWIMVDIGVTFADDTIPGVDLIYPDPGFPIYRSMIKFSGAKGIPLELSEDDNFEINIQKTTLIKKSWAPLYSNPPKKYWCQTIMKKTHGFES